MKMRMIRTAALLALCLALCGLALASEAEESSLAGVWVLTRMAQGGTEVPATDTRDNFVMELREDNTLTYYYLGQPEEGLLDPAAGRITLEDGETYAFVRDGDALRLDAGDGVILIMTRTGETVEEIFAPARAIAERLVGRWRITAIVSDDGERRGRAQLEQQGYDAMVEFTADGRMRMRVGPQDGSAPAGDFAYRVGGCHVLILNDDVSVFFDLADHMLGLRQRGGMHYYLPWNEEGAATLEGAPVGLWELVSIGAPDGTASMDSETFRRMGFRETLEITADGRSILSQYRNGALSGEPSVRRYEIIAPGIMVLDGSYVERYTLEGDTLTLHESHDELVFVRVTEQPDEAGSAAGEDTLAGEDEAPASPADAKANTPAATGAGEDETPADPAEAETQAATEAGDDETPAEPAEAETPAFTGISKDGASAEPAEAETPAATGAGEDEAPDVPAALVGQWRLDSIVYDGGDTVTSLDLSVMGCGELLEFTPEGVFTFTQFEEGSKPRQETRTFTADGANFVTLSSGEMLPWGFEGERLVLIRQDGRYFYRPAEAETAPGEPLSDERLIGVWRLVGMRLSGDEGPVEIDRATLEYLGMTAWLEFTADGGWISTVQTESGEEREESSFAITAPGVLLVDRSYHMTYTLEDGLLTLRAPDGSETTYERAEEPPAQE